ncbi:MAG: hypothetical protein NVS4B6_28390 [Mycobacterium sp.]
MNYAFVRMKQRRRIVTPAAAALLALGGFALPTPAASADAVAYLVNVTVRPGYNFANADQALAYGHEVCDKIAAGRQAGRPDAQPVGDIKSDFNMADEFQASYVITQAANELCPAQIWKLRNSAAGYTGSP